MNKSRIAKYTIGQVVRHRLYPFRGIVFDIDPIFANTEEWYQSIPAERRPSKDQPFYHLYAENADTEYVAYVSEQNLLPDSSEEPLAASAGGGDFREGRERQLSSARTRSSTDSAIARAATRAQVYFCCPSNFFAQLFVAALEVLWIGRRSVVGLSEVVSGSTRLIGWLAPLMPWMTRPLPFFIVSMSAWLTS